jgi:hypothetical protein
MLENLVILDGNNQLISIPVCSIETANEHGQRVKAGKGKNHNSTFVIHYSIFMATAKNNEQGTRNSAFSKY